MSIGALYEVVKQWLNENAQWLTSGATLALAIVTFVTLLVTLFVTLVMPWCRRPKFSVRFDKKDCRKANSPQQSYWLRLRVTNSGRSVARKCVGRIVKFRDKSEERTDLDPVMLHWVGTDWGKHPPYFTTIDLNRKEPSLLDVLITKANSPCKASFIFTHGFLDGTNTTDILFGNGNIQVTIYGDDVKPCAKKYSIIWNGCNHTDIRLKEIRPFRDGLLQTLKKLKSWLD